jgi:HEAT repeat protein
VAPSDSELRSLFRARLEGDSDYLIEWVRRFPDDATLALGWLADWEERRASPDIIRLLRAKNADTRRSAVIALGSLGPPPEARDAIEEIAVSDPDPATRSWAYLVLGKYRDPTLLALLLSALDEPAWLIRNGAASGLGELGDKTALPALRHALKRLRRNPFHWYMSRTACKWAIKQLS